MNLTMESLTSSSPNESKICNNHHAVRLSLYQITIVLVGCAVISFRAGLVISNSRRVVQPPHQCINMNITTPNAAVVGRFLNGNNPQVESSCYQSETLQSVISHCRIDNSTTTGADYCHKPRHNHRPRRMITSWPEKNSALHRDEDDSANENFFEAMVHPSLLIHPKPNRIVIVHDIGGQILPQVLKHKMVQEVMYIVPESLKHRSLFTNLSDPRVVVVYANDPIPSMQRWMSVDVLFVDAVTYVHVRTST